MSDDEWSKQALVRYLTDRVLGVDPISKIIAEYARFAFQTTSSLVKMIIKDACDVSTVDGTIFFARNRALNMTIATVGNTDDGCFYKCGLPFTAASGRLKLAIIDTDANNEYYIAHDDKRIQLESPYKPRSMFFAHDVFIVVWPIPIMRFAIKLYNHAGLLLELVAPRLFDFDKALCTSSTEIFIPIHRRQLLDREFYVAPPRKSNEEKENNLCFGVFDFNSGAFLRTIATRCQLPVSAMAYLDGHLFCVYDNRALVIFNPGGDIVYQQTRISAVCATQDGVFAVNGDSICRFE